MHFANYDYDPTEVSMKVFSCVAYIYTNKYKVLDIVCEIYSEGHA